MSIKQRQWPGMRSIQISKSLFKSSCNQYGIQKFPVTRVTKLRKMASRIVLITGANSGVGFATAKVIASSSASFHVLAAARSLAKAETAISELKATGTIKGELSPIVLDVTDEPSVEKAAKLVADKFGRLDVLINNAGIAMGNLAQCMAVNVGGTATVSKAFRPLLLKADDPYSVYVSSVVGSLAMAADPESATYRGPPGGEAYRASKAALNMYYLQELVQIRDNKVPLKTFAVCPGFVRSNLAGKGEVAKKRNAIAGDPEDSGRTILSVIKGERDADIGKMVHQNGVYPW